MDEWALDKSRMAPLIVPDGTASGKIVRKYQPAEVKAREVVGSACNKTVQKRRTARKAAKNAKRRNR